MLPKKDSWIVEKVIKKEIIRSFVSCLALVSTFVWIFLLLGISDAEAISPWLKNLIFCMMIISLITIPLNIYLSYLRKCLLINCDGFGENPYIDYYIAGYHEVADEDGVKPEILFVEKDHVLLSGRQRKRIKLLYFKVNKEKAYLQKGCPLGNIALNVSDKDYSSTIIYLKPILYIKEEYDPRQVAEALVLENCRQKRKSSFPYPRIDTGYFDQYEAIIQVAMISFIENEINKIKQMVDFRSSDDAGSLDPYRERFKWYMEDKFSFDFLPNVSLLEFK